MENTLKIKNYLEVINVAFEFQAAKERNIENYIYNIKDWKILTGFEAEIIKAEVSNIHSEIMELCNVAKNHYSKFENMGSLPDLQIIYTKSFTGQENLYVTKYFFDCKKYYIIGGTINGQDFDELIKKHNEYTEHEKPDTKMFIGSWDLYQYVLSVEKIMSKLNITTIIPPKPTNFAECLVHENKPLLIESIAELLNGQGGARIGFVLQYLNDNGILNFLSITDMIERNGLYDFIRAQFNLTTSNSGIGKYTSNDFLLCKTISSKDTHIKIISEKLSNI